MSTTKYNTLEEHRNEFFSKCYKIIFQQSLRMITKSLLKVILYNILYFKFLNFWKLNVKIFLTCDWIRKLEEISNKLNFQNNK